MAVEWRAMATPRLQDLPTPDRAWFHDPDGIHGVAHTLRVVVHARRLAEALALDPTATRALLTAALWHDIGRLHDGTDDLHGARSAGKVLGLGLHRDLDDATARTVLFAIEHHCLADQRAQRSAGRISDFARGFEVFQALKDADALDRVRLGGRGEVDPAQLRFDFSRRQLDFADELLAKVR